MTRRQSRPAVQLKHVLITVLTMTTMSAGHAGLIVSESADAGELPGAAVLTAAAPELDAIRGSLTGSGGDQADLFGIRLTAGQTFSASMTGSSLAYNSFDMGLFLFDSGGFGLVANDDSDSSPPQSSIQFTPSVTGVYYLAIAGIGYTPVSAAGAIFPAQMFGSTAEFGPTGPGGASALAGWEGTTSEGDAYEILLTGAQGWGEVTAVVPEPGTFLLTGLALSLVGLGRRRGSRKV
jgi:hypothetical protein